MSFILGKKLGMTQVFDEGGNVLPITVIEAGPVIVTQVKTKEKDGYLAIQVGFSLKKNSNKPLKEGAIGNFRYLREFKINSQDPSLVKGDRIDVSIFRIGEKVSVSGVSKSYGFQGVVKRHGFRGASKTHGTKHAHREPGSIGSTWPQRVIKGKKMAGRMGGHRTTIKNLQIVNFDKENNLLAISGAVPGRKGTLLEISSC